MAGQKRGRSGGVAMDKLLVARIDEFSNARSGNFSEDELVDFLRDRFPEYKRYKIPIFKNTVSKALDTLAAKKGDLPSKSDSKHTSDNEEDNMQTEPNTPNTPNTPNADGALIDLTIGSTQEKEAESQAQQTSTNANEAKQDKLKKRKERDGVDGKLSKKSKKQKIMSAVSNEFDRQNNSEEAFQATTRPTLRFKDLGGIEGILQDIKELIEYPLTHPEIFQELGTEPPRGVLLHGPPGCGKTLLANAIAGELGVAFLKISAPEVVSGMSGESEAKIRSLFLEAKKSAPCIVFIDEIDAITAKRENAQREMERRIVAQLLTCMDDISSSPVMVIGATNRPDALDTALRRAGRFDREISLGIPDEGARIRILEVMCSKLKLSGDFNYKVIARQTPGFVGADLNALTKEAAVIAINRIFHQLFDDVININTTSTPNDAEMPISITNGDANEIKQELTELITNNIKEDEASKNAPHEDLEKRLKVSDHLRANAQPLSRQQLDKLSITMQDFELAIKKVQPSSKREGFATIPDVTFSDIGALEEIQSELRLSIMEPIQSPEIFSYYGLNRSTGVLLYGPPGCGKTLLAKAIANESGANFISIKGPELLNKFVGESERAVRQVFARGRASSPCVIFFDELDALCPRRGRDNNQATERVVNQLLTEMDGLEERKQVFVIAATNRPDIIDPAMLRPGRLDKLLYVHLPNVVEREKILLTICRTKPLSQNVDLAKIARDPRADGFSGADLASLVREASIGALCETLKNKRLATQGKAIVADDSVVKPPIETNHFESAFSKVFPSVAKKDQKLYDQMQKKLRNSRSHIQQESDVNDGTRDNIDVNNSNDGVVSN